MAEYRFPVPGTIIMRIIQNTPKPFPREVAMLSLMVDMDGDGPKSERSYARIWGWSRGRVRNRIDEMIEEVEKWSFTRNNSGENPSPPQAHPKPTQKPTSSPKKLAKSNKRVFPKPTSSPPKSPLQAHPKPTTTHTTDTEKDGSSTTTVLPSERTEVLQPGEKSARAKPNRRKRYGKTSAIYRTVASLEELELDEADRKTIAHIAPGVNIDRELTRFEYHCKSTGVEYEDYRARFHKWCMDQVDYNARGKSQNTTPAPPEGGYKNETIDEQGRRIRW